MTPVLTTCSTVAFPPAPAVIEGCLSLQPSGLGGGLPTGELYPSDEFLDKLSQHKLLGDPTIPPPTWGPG